MMLRRLITVMLILALVLQGMALCQAQETGCLHKHAQEDLLPHIHLCTIGLHDHESHQHVDEAEKAKEDGQCAHWQKDRNDLQDDDAVYVSAISILCGNHWHFHFDMTGQSTIAFQQVFVDLNTVTRSIRLSITSPDSNWYGRSTYLRNLALII
jgi:hypothetical protein